MTVLPFMLLIRLFQSPAFWTQSVNVSAGTDYVHSFLKNKLELGGTGLIPWLRATVVQRRSISVRGGRLEFKSQLRQTWTPSLALPSDCLVWELELLCCKRDTLRSHVTVLL